MMLTDAHEVDQSITELDWVQKKSIQLLMEIRLAINILTALAMLLMAGQLYGRVNSALIITWLIASLFVLLVILYYKKLFTRKTHTANTSEKIKQIDSYSQIWSLNAFIWGLSSWLFFGKLPIQNQFVCVCILSTMGVIGLVKLAPYRIVARRYLDVLLGTQVVGIVWHIGIVNKMQSPPLQYYYLVSLVILWIIFRVLGNRLYSAFHRSTVLHFRNAYLIESLKRQTKQLEHEKQLALSDTETIKRFYSSAAHDIRQPVYALSIYSGLLKEDPSQALQLSPKIIQSCNAINALFESLFDFEKIQLGQVKVVYEQVNITALFDELQLHFSPSANDKHLKMRFLPLSGSLLTDAALIRCIFNHLIANAIRYTNQGGLLVAARKYANHISFEVWDTGIGITGDHHTQVFDEFFKVNEQSGSDAGFGLGLAVVKRLAALVEGSSVTMMSKLGQGSVFKFKVPLSMYSLSGS